MGDDDTTADLKLLVDEAYGNFANTVRILKELNDVARDRWFSIAITHAEEGQNALLRYVRDVLKG
jgi:hypothetical protein